MAQIAVPQVHGSQIFTTPGSYSFTVPAAYVGEITVIAQGAGGGGSASDVGDSTTYPMQVGGAGGICVKKISVTASEVFTGTVGSGGGGYVLGTTGDGSNGGNTTFTGSGVSMTAAGGLGGWANGNDATPAASSGGDYNMSANPPDSLYYGATRGADSLFGLGGANASGSNVSGGGGAPGAGGGVLTLGSSSWGGGGGGSGAVLVIW